MSKPRTILIALLVLALSACERPAKPVPVETLLSPMPVVATATATVIAVLPTEAMSQATATATGPAATATTVASPTETSQPSTAMVQPPAPTASTQPLTPPATAIPPTATAVPPTATPEPMRIAFAPGTTSIALQGNIGAQSVDRYVLSAQANQLMEVNVAATAPNVRLFVLGSDGVVLKSGLIGPPSFRGVLPTTQDYLIYIAADGQATAYTLGVVIPQRLSFAPNATQMGLDGSYPITGEQYYVLRAAGGQLMDVQVMTVASSAMLAIYGADGVVLKEAGVAGPFFRGTLPATQDYILRIAGPSGAPYSLSILIPQRIIFDAGATSAVVEGDLAPQDNRAYVVHMAAGQTLDVRATAPPESVRLIIYGVDGDVLRSGMAGTPDYRGQVRTTQDYIISVSAAQQAHYVMTVIIPARITFQPGAISGTAQGTVRAGATNSYVIGASGGQTMSVVLISPVSLLLGIEGNDGVRLKPYQSGGNTWQGILPATQDYWINVLSTGAAGVYQIQVTIQ